MAKLALIEREKKRARLAAKYAPKRAELKAIIGDMSKSEEEHYAARLELQQLPRNSNPLVSAIVAQLPVVRAARSVNSGWRVTRFVKSRSAARSLA